MPLGVELVGLMVQMPRAIPCGSWTESSLTIHARSAHVAAEVAQRIRGGLGSSAAAHAGKDCVTTSWLAKLKQLVGQYSQLAPRSEIEQQPGGREGTVNLRKV